MTVETIHWKLCRAIYDEMGLRYIDGETSTQERFDKAVASGEEIQWLIGEPFHHDGNICIKKILEGSQETLEYIMRLVQI